MPDNSSGTLPAEGMISVGGGPGGPSEVGTLPMIPAPNNIVIPPGHAIIWSVGPDHVDNGRWTKPVASARLAVGSRHLSPDAVVDKQSNPQMFVDEFGAAVAWSRDVGMM